MANSVINDFPSSEEMRNYTWEKNNADALSSELSMLLVRMKRSKEPRLIVPNITKECISFLKDKGYTITKTTLLHNGKYYCIVSWK